MHAGDGGFRDAQVCMGMFRLHGIQIFGCIEQMTRLEQYKSTI